MECLNGDKEVWGGNFKQVNTFTYNVWALYIFGKIFVSGIYPSQRLWKVIYLYEVVRLYFGIKFLIMISTILLCGASCNVSICY